MGNPIEIDDAIVLLLGTATHGATSGEIRGITRLEKLIFLLERETSSKDWLQQDAGFEAYNFGPFSQKIYQAVDTLAAAQLIEDSSSLAPDTMDSWEEREVIGPNSGSPGDRINPYTTRDFHLTERGWRYFNALKQELTPEAMVELQNFKRQFAFLPLRQLIRYVYSRYEEFTTKSLIRDEVLGTGG
ncbi:hypothetical protein [Arthrobacter cryoconiti]|uniref:Antitoxin SocA-like Panacea domain-containing protein n=1 Tax=Arthrobacter cryoconiti TaxID=748907 RepID=A0ABV8R0Y9_9MICC|nr:hypothetical protein [Arthrobacter cryoconiti]MCC9068563.1 hypothetical protein [Arthrobacter cryoconiti]